MDIKSNIITNVNTVDTYVGNDISSKLGSESGKSNTNEVTHVAKSNSYSDNFEQNSDKEKYTKQELDNALNKINNFLKDEKTHAEYSIHEAFGTLMIKVVDDESNKVILEIPPKKILDMVASMCRQVGLLDKKAWYLT